MERFSGCALIVIAILFGFSISNPLYSQNTKIRGFVEAHSVLKDGEVSFGFGEQDLFITSELNDHLSFLGETVFKYDPNSSTEFSVSIERIVIKYNYKGNHSVLVGKHHTPINYWNDTYHHGRVFFPTVERPLLFAANILPLHTTGVSLQGLNLGSLKFGYEVMIGNGLGSNQITDNDKRKSIAIAVNIKPIEHLQIGMSYYNDVISEGAEVHGMVIDEKIKQQLLSGSVAYFGKKYEFLTESTFAFNKAASTGSVPANASYMYGGYKVSEKWIPYLRFDILNFQSDEIYYDNEDRKSFVLGLRFEINYLAVVKLEYQYEDREILGEVDKLTAQIAIGF